MFVVDKSAQTAYIWTPVFLLMVGYGERIFSVTQVRGKALFQFWDKYWIKADYDSCVAHILRIPTLLYVVFWGRWWWLEDGSDRDQPMAKDVKILTNELVYADPARLLSWGPRERPNDVWEQ